jgi:hypothetical protein
MTRRWLAAALMIFALAGCKFTDMPDLAHPRSATIQQKRALRYDPLPESNAVTDMSTVRPREYQNPPADPSQARWHLDQATNSTRWGTEGHE